MLARVLVEFPVEEDSGVEPGTEPGFPVAIELVTRIFGILELEEKRRSNLLSRILPHCMQGINDIIVTNICTLYMYQTLHYGSPDLKFVSVRKTQGSLLQEEKTHDHWYKLKTTICVFANLNN